MNLVFLRDVEEITFLKITASKKRFYNREEVAAFIYEIHKMSFILSFDSFFYVTL